MKIETQAKKWFSYKKLCNSNYVTTYSKQTIKTVEKRPQKLFLLPILTKYLSTGNASNLLKVNCDKNKIMSINFNLASTIIFEHM